MTTAEKQRKVNRCRIVEIVEIVEWGCEGIMGCYVVADSDEGKDRTKGKGVGEGGKEGVEVVQRRSRFSFAILSFSVV